MNKPIIGIVAKHYATYKSNKIDTFIRDEVKQAIFDNGGIAIGILSVETAINYSGDNWKDNLSMDEKENLILDGVQIEFENSLTKENINIIENTTKRIAVEISTSKENTESTDPVRNENIDGIKEISKAGYVKITDSKDATYYYQRVKTTDSADYAKLVELAEKLNKEYDGMDMYQKVQENEQFYSLYSKLINEANCQEVENMEVKQPESTEQSNGVGDKYIVFLKKVAKDGETTDAQFLQEYYDYEPNAVKEQIKTQETTRLPITYDSIALIVILAVVVALIIVFIRMKKINKKDEEK